MPHPAPNSQPFVEALKALSDQYPMRLELEADAVALACVDWRKRYHTQALACVGPSTVAGLQAVVKLCATHGVCITTQGGNTGLVGGAVPAAEVRRPHVVLWTSNLREHLQVDAANLAVQASAGYTLLEMQQAAAQAGLLFPLSLASEGTCTLGGNLASNAGGTAVLKYGNARELCLGLQYVNAEGDLCGDLRGLRKNNTGYDLRHLLIGSEGTLGIITEAVMRVVPAPKSSCVAWFNVSSLTTAIELLGKLQALAGDVLTGFEWMNAESMRLVSAHFGQHAPGADEHLQCEHVLAEFSGPWTQAALNQRVEDAFAEVLEAMPGVSNAVLSQNLAQQKAFWALRELISEAQAKEGLNIKHDVACPIGRLPAFHARVTQMLSQLGLEVRPVLFGHLGDGNLHYNMSAPLGMNAQQFLHTHQAQINQVVHEAVLAEGGTVSAEHGIGQLKAELLKAITPPETYAQMLTIKRAMDPQNLLNPGKLVLN